MALRDLFVQIGVKADTKGLDKIDEQIDKIENGLGKVGDNKALDDMSKSADKAEKSSGRLAGALGKIGATGAVLAGAVAGVGAIGFKLAEAAGSAQAAQSQFNQVFNGIEQQATENLNNIAEQTNILPSRLQGSFSQIAAFAKTSGADQATALDITTRATMAAADSAAFYDRNIEEVTENLQSFLKGNYENDAALGISATEFTRNAAAAELFGKKFNDLSEIQKQQTLLKLVEDGNKLSGSFGQAAREGGGFENVVGNLRQAWTDLLARLGSPILNTVTGFIQKLSDVINAIQPQKFIDFFRQATDGGGKLAPIIEAVRNTISNLVNNVIVPAIPIAISMFQQLYGVIAPVLQNAFSLIGTVGSAILNFVNAVVIPLLPVVGSVFQTAFNIVLPILRATWSVLGLVINAIKFLVNEIVVPLFPVFTSVIQTAYSVVSPILQFLVDKFQSVSNVVQEVISFVGSLGKKLGSLNIGEKIGKFAEGVKNLVPGFNSGLGNVPEDNMLARLHKGEAVLQTHNAEALRNAGILKGDGRNPELDLSAATQLGAPSVQAAPTMTTNNNRSASVSAPVTIYVQGGGSGSDTANNIKEKLESFFLDLRYQMEG